MRKELPENKLFFCSSFLGLEAHFSSGMCIAVQEPSSGPDGIGEMESHAPTSPASIPCTQPSPSSDEGMVPVSPQWIEDDEEQSWVCPNNLLSNIYCIYIYFFLHISNNKTKKR